MLFGTLRVWAIEVQRRFLYKLRQKDIAVSPPILHANQCLVFCTRLTSVAQGTGFMPVSAPSTDRISLACPSLCTSCGRPVVNEVFCLSLFHGVCVRALCICQPRGKTFALRSLANRSCVTVHGVSLGHVIPITSTAKATCTPVQEMNTCSPDSGWSAQFQALVFQPSTSPQPGPMRVVSVNCGGTAANIAALLSVVLIHDPDVVAIQELWDVSLKDEVPLKAYVAIAGVVVGPGCGLCFLFHRRLFAPNDFKPSYTQVLFDARSWLAVLVQHGTGEVVLYTNVHIDPEFNATQKEDVLIEIGAVFQKVRPTAGICLGDFNVPRTASNCIARQLAKGGALSHLKLDYLPGQFTNIVHSSTGVTKYEIDYILVSNHLSVEDFHVYPGVCTHGVLVADVGGLQGSLSSFQKRYKHRITTPEVRSSLACLVAVFWWWMSQISAPPDDWIFAYWTLADRFLFSQSLRRSAEGLMKKGRQLARKHVGRAEVSSWKIEIQDHLFARGLKLTQDILNQVSITAHTTSAMRLRRSMPQPYPNLVQDSRGSEASVMLCAAQQQLRFYHLSKGECMNLPVLLYNAKPHDALCAVDDLPYAILFRQIRDGIWSLDRQRYLFGIQSLPKAPLFTAAAIRRGLDRGGSDAASLDDVPFSLLQALPACAESTLLSYSKLLTLYEEALSNVVLQMGIVKGGASFLFNSYRPIKMGSSFSRLFAGVVHDDVVTRGEAMGTWCAGLFSYRKELCPAFMALSARATVGLSLIETGECHIVDGDESGAFDMPVREDVAVFSKVWPGQCSYGEWAKNFYGRQQVRLWTVCGLAPPVTPELGFAQGCTLAATAFTDLGILRSRCLQTLGEGWWLRSGVPLFEFTFSDDRRWFGRTAAEASRVATIAHVLSGDACAPSNKAKMAYTILRLQPDGAVRRVPGVLDVHGTPVSASDEVPVIVGITLEPLSVSSVLFTKFMKRSRTLRSFVRRFQPNLLLALRAVMAYLIAILDSVAKGSALPHSVSETLQVPVNDIFRSLLLLPRDLAVDIMHTPISYGGWGSVWLPVRSELNFLSGFLSALDCRSVLTRSVLREQLRCPLPGRNDDGSVFRRLCAKYSISSERPPHVFPVVDLDLPLCLVRASVLFVTTDAGHEMGDSNAILERGGLGIIFSGGGRVQHRIVLGIRCAAGSSTVLEWLAKIIALWILARAGFKGSVCLLCDNAAVQTCYFDRWIRTATWFDRLAKWVFRQPVMQSVIELWLPAQHDSGDTGVAASWQRQADAAATRGLEDPDRYPIPWGALLGVLEDPPSPVCYQGSVVFKLNAFMDKLYDSTLGQQSALGRWVQEHGFDMSTWGRVCHDTGVTLSQHRQANHLRTMQFLARVFFDVSDCRYCGLYHGNEQTHVGACVELYDRQCRTVVAVAEFMSRELDYNVLASWDTVLQLCKSEVVVWIAVEVDALFAVRKAALCRLPGQQVVVITVSGLLWVSQPSSRSPGYLSALVRQQLSKLVLQRMHEGVHRSEPHACSVVPDLSLSPFVENGLVSAPVLFQLQMVMAWVVRRDPRLVVAYRARYHVSLPSRVFRDPSPLDYVLFVCTDNQCMLQYPRQSRRSVVLCGCSTSPASVWHVVSAGLGWVLVADHNYSMPQLN